MLSSLRWWNWYKRWPLSELLCKLGRHDFEASTVVDGKILLECFYCEQSKLSSPAKKGDPPPLFMTPDEIAANPYLVEGPSGVWTPERAEKIKRAEGTLESFAAEVVDFLDGEVIEEDDVIHFSEYADRVRRDASNGETRFRESEQCGACDHVLPARGPCTLALGHGGEHSSSPANGEPTPGEKGASDAE